MNIHGYNRIMIIGNNGSGKSYLSKALAAITGLPLVHLDALYWLPDLQRPPDEEWRQKNIELIAAEKWILDGNFAQGGAMELRCAAADLVLYLDVNRLVCLAGAIKRSAKDKRSGKDRPDGPQDFREQFDRRFFGLCKAIWNHSKGREGSFLALREKYPGTPFFVIKGRRKMHKLLRQWRMHQEALEY